MEIICFSNDINEKHLKQSLCGMQQEGSNASECIEKPLNKPEN
jgi:hypothetical protein